MGEMDIQYRVEQQVRALVLITDALGGQGGIAKFNRDLLTAMCSHPDCMEVVAIPRLMPNPPRPASIQIDLCNRRAQRQAKVCLHRIKEPILGMQNLI